MVAKNFFAYGFSWCHLYSSKCRVTVCLGPYTRGSNYDFDLADEDFSRNKNGGQEVT